MSTTYLTVYVRELSGNLTRRTIDGMDKDAHIELHNIGPVTGVENLAGWPETTVEWHESIGYGHKGQTQ